MPDAEIEDEVQRPDTEDNVWHGTQRRIRRPGKLLGMSHFNVFTDLDTRITGWMSEGNCVGTDPEAFFPEMGHNVPRAVRGMCETCPVQQRCLEYAVENYEVGFWGNTTSDERARIRTGRKALQASRG